MPMRRLLQIVLFVAIMAAPAIVSAQASPTLKPHNPIGREEINRPGGLSSPLALVGSLVLVVGAFLVVVWALRRASPAGSAVLPAEVFETLGRAPLANRQQAVMLRLGNKLLLVALSATDARTLAEITDTAEVDRLAELCRQTRPRSAATAFRHVLGRKEGSDE